MLPSMLTHSASASFIHSFIHLFIHSFIHSDHFYSASLGPLLLRSAPDTARILCRIFTPKRHRQLRVNDLPKVPTRAGFEPTTLRLKSIVSTKAPPRPTIQLTCELIVTHQFTDFGNDKYTPFKSGFAFLETESISEMLKTITFLSIVFAKCFTSPLKVLCEVVEERFYDCQLTAYIVL